MGYLTTKYKGKYRLKCEVDKVTNDFPKTLKDTYEDADVYIDCSFGNKIFYYGKGILQSYIPSLQRGRNIIRKLYAENINPENVSILKSGKGTTYKIIDHKQFNSDIKNSKFIWILDVLSRIGLSTDANNVRIVITTVIAFVISVTNSYFWNNRYVFSSGKKSFAQHIKTYFKTFACYGITGLVISPIIKILLDRISVPYFIASLGALVITIPLNFIMNKFWAFRAKNTEDEINENQTC